MAAQNRNPEQIRARKESYSGTVLISANGAFMLLVALAPILQHYKGIVINPSLAIIIFMAITAAFKLVTKKVRFGTGFLLLALYGFYASVIHGINLVYLLREITQLVVYLAVINGLFDIKKLLKFSRVIATLATTLIIVQYICYYIFGFHLQLVATSLLDPGNSQWFGLTQTGLIGVTGTRLAFYRPSAFFLEPSHFAIYCIPSIVTELFSKNGDTRIARRRALYISLGVLMSTSGMGIGVVIMCWAIYFGFFYGQHGKVRTVQLKKLLNVRSIAMLLAFVLILVALYVGVPVFRKSVMRIFVSEGGSSITAVQGRTLTGRRALGMLTGIRRYIGFGDIYDISNWNMASFFFVTFRFGWIGTAIFYSFYIYSFMKLRREAQLMTLIFLILSFFTVHMFGAYYKMFYTMIIMNGYLQLEKGKHH